MKKRDRSGETIPNSSDHFSELRQLAMERIKGRFPDAADISDLSMEKVQRLVHDLQVHQIELEIQNEELRRAQQALEESRNRYSDLYDFAPVGYFTLDHRGCIRELNLTGSMLLDVHRESVISVPFHGFITPDSQDDWYQFRKRVRKSEKNESCEIRMKKRTGGTFHARLESVLIRKDGEETDLCRTVVSDITDLKLAEQQIRAALEEKQVLLREIHHRVKNNLALISSLLTLQSQVAEDRTSRQAFEDVQTRIRSMAVAHEILYQSENLACLDVADYVENLLGHLMGSLSLLGREIFLTKKIDEVSFGIDTAIPLGFILTELFTNCLKHAFVDRTKGHVKVVLRPSGDEEFQLIVADDGVGMSEEIDLEYPQSVGMELVNSFVERLDGEIEIRRKNGTEVRITFREV